MARGVTAEHGFVTDLSHRDLHRDNWVCLVSADNPAVGAELTVDHLESLPWVVTYHGPTASTPASSARETTRPIM